MTYQCEFCEEPATHQGTVRDNSEDVLVMSCARHVGLLHHGTVEVIKS